MNGALAEASQYIGDGRGFFSVLMGSEQHSYRLSELPQVLDALPADAEAFLSQASFKRPNRRLVNLHRLGVCFVDCDTNKTARRSQSPEQQAQAVLLHCEDNGLPRPSLINHSGRGLHVKWCLDKPLPAQALPRWNAVQKQLVNALEPFGADKAARDGSRCLRVVGSINPRNGQTARTVYQDGARWDFDLLAREVLPIDRQELQQKRQAKQEAKAAGTGRVCNLWQPRQLWWNRLADVRKLIELRGWTQGVPEGSRTNFLLVATCWRCVGRGTARLVRRSRNPAAGVMPVAHTPRSAFLRVCRRPSRPGRQAVSVHIGTALRMAAHQCEEQRKLKTLFDLDERKQRDRERHRKYSDRQTYESRHKPEDSRRRHFAQKA